MAASHSCAYMVGLLVLPTSTHPLACVSRCPIGGRGHRPPPPGGGLEKTPGGETPPPPSFSPWPPPRARPPGRGDEGRGGAYAAGPSIPAAPAGPPRGGGGT